MSAPVDPNAKRELLLRPLSRYFDRLALEKDLYRRTGYTAVGALDHAGYIAALFADLDRLLQVQAGQRALDVGCGTGDFLALLHEHAGQAEGIDISANMVAAANARELKATVYDGGTFPFPAMTFDRVLINFVLINTPLPRIAKTLIDELLRVLKPGGRLVIGRNPKPERHAYLSASRYALVRQLRQALQRRDSHLWLVAYDYAFFLDFYARGDLDEIDIVDTRPPSPDADRFFHVLMRKRG